MQTCVRVCTGTLLQVIHSYLNELVVAAAADHDGCAAYLAVLFVQSLLSA